MPYESNWEEQGLYLTFYGKFIDNDLLEAHMPIYDDPRALTMKYQIVDFTQVTHNSLSLSTVRTIASLDTKLSHQNPDVKVATVATTQLMLGLTKMYESEYSQLKWTTEIFETVEEAEVWATTEN